LLPGRLFDKLIQPEMETPSHSSTNGDSQAFLTEDAAQPAPSPHGMSSRTRLLFYLTAWLIVLLPFLFWWNTWFGRQLSDGQITQYLADDKRPRHIQHALVQIGERIGRHDTRAARWYPELIRLATHPVEEVRNTDAWVMGQDSSGAGFHAALLRMLQDSSPTVRGNAALSLVRFGDYAGREPIVALLQPAHIVAPVSGHVIDADKPGTAIHQGGIIAKLGYGQEQTIDVRSPIAGRIQSISASTGTIVAAGAEIATVAPGDEQVWEALRALYLIGRAEDLPAIRPYERESRDIPDRVRQQALLADRAIRSRASAQP
jgi:HlyD family secretion protein/HEAT repeat